MPRQPDPVRLERLLAARPEVARRALEVGAARGEAAAAAGRLASRLRWGRTIAGLLGARTTVLSLRTLGPVFARLAKTLLGGRR
jgi:hypothetical protein